jgi:hypothetical protein
MTFLSAARVYQQRLFFYSKKTNVGRKRSLQKKTSITRLASEGLASGISLMFSLHSLTSYSLTFSHSHVLTLSRSHSE